MLDKLPAWARHFLIAVIAGVLTFGSQLLANGSDKVTAKDVALGVGAIVLTQLALALTPLTQQYGVGAADPPVPPVVE